MKIIKVSIHLTTFDVQQSLKAGWELTTHKNKLALKNKKTIFVPNYMPKL